LDRALAINPTDHTARRNRALALLALGRADEAAVIFAALPMREPGEAIEYFALGNAFARDGKFPEAVAAYTRTVTLDPAHVAARANLGNALLVSGRAREAIAAYEAALRLNPGDRGLLENLAIARETAAARR
jgi:tetratricopeptide (TPR) repeat protein